MSRRALALVALAACAVGSAIGCNLLVSAGDYKVGSALGADASAQEAGPVQCGDGIASGDEFDQLVKSCVLAVSCDPYFADWTVRNCISYDLLHAYPSDACLLGLQSCNDYYGCNHVRRAALADCPSAGAKASCDGGLAVNCAGQGTGAVIDCSKAGTGVCGTFTNAAGAVVADCVVVGSCSDAPDAGEHCSGNDLYTCFNGKGYGGHCGTGLTCTTVAGQTGCYYDLPTCSTPDTYECSGDAVRYCSTAKTLISENCAATGSTCALDDAGVGRCVSPGCTVDDAKGCTESCGADGKTLNTCIGGVPYAIDCTQLDTFTQCAQATDKSGTQPVVYTFCE